MNPRVKSTEKKVYVQGRVNEDVYNEFIQNALQFKGPKHGHAGLSLEEAMRLFNNYFKQFHDKALSDVAKEMDIAPNELGSMIIKRFMDLHKYGMGMDTITDEEHLELIKKHLNII